MQTVAAPGEGTLEDRVRAIEDLLGALVSSGPYGDTPLCREYHALRQRRISEQGKKKED